ncbi:MAG TPA: hypothetical protein DCS84_08980 [Microbacterium sp.]|nr:hypothetical protein [Microbacterium sp.]
MNLEPTEYRRWTSELAEHLRNARARKNLSQEQVAHAAGVSLNTYTRLERDTPGALPNPTVRTVLRILDVLDLEAAPPRPR